MPEHRQFHLDEIIREALHEKVNSGPPPLLEASEAWKQIETRMSEKRKKTLPLRILRNPLLIAAAVLFIFIFATTPKSGIAFNQFTDIFHTIQGNVVHLLGKSGDPGEGSGESDGTFEVIEDSEIIS